MQITKTKGRSSNLIARRNKRLAARFYFYNIVIGLKFSRCLDLLEQEFDLSEARICDLLPEVADEVNELDRICASPTQLKEMYPFLSWNYTPPRSTRQLSLF